MTDPFDAKVARSEEHINAIRDTIRDHIDANMQEILGHYDADQHGIVLDRDLEPPERVKLIAGDAVQNLRAALDHLAFALVEANKTTPTEATQFPIMLRGMDAKGNVLPVKVDGDVSDLALTEIERLQPYHVGHPSQAAMTPLGMLKELSNIDKHRYLALVDSRVGEGSHLIIPHLKTPPTIRYTLIGHMEDGAVFKASSDDDMNVQGRLSLQVAIAPSVPIGSNPPAFPKGYEPLVGTLRIIAAEVRLVVDTLRRFL